MKFILITAFMIMLSLSVDIRTCIHLVFFYLKCSVVNVVLSFVRALHSGTNTIDHHYHYYYHHHHHCCERVVVIILVNFLFFFFIANNASFSNDKRSPNAFLTSSIANEKVYLANVKKLSFHNAVRRTTTMSYYP